MQPFLIFYIVMIVIIISNQQRRQAMRPKVLLEPAEFLKVIEGSDNKIIQTSKVFLQGYMCVMIEEDYTYYTMSKQPIALPAGREIVRARMVQL